MFRFTIRDVLWLTAVIALIVWSQMRHARHEVERAELARKTEILEDDVRKWKGRAGTVAQTLGNLGIPVTFNEKTRGMSYGPIPKYITDHDRATLGLREDSGPTTFPDEN